MLLRNSWKTIPVNLSLRKIQKKRFLVLRPRKNFPSNLPKWYNWVALKSSISGSGGSSHNGSCSAKSTAVSNWLRNSSWGQPSCRGKLHCWWFFRIERSKGSTNGNKKCHAFWSSPTKLKETSLEVMKFILGMLFQTASSYVTEQQLVLYGIELDSSMSLWQIFPLTAPPCCDFA